MNCAVNLNTAHSPSVCSVFDEIQKYLKFLVFPWYHDNNVSVIMITSSSKISAISRRVDLNIGYSPAVFISIQNVGRSIALIVKMIPCHQNVVLLFLALVSH